MISLNRRESWTTVFWLEFTFEKFQVLVNQSQLRCVVLEFGLLLVCMSFLSHSFSEYLMKERIVISSRLSANVDQGGDGSTPRLSRADMDLLFDPSG